MKRWPLLALLSLALISSALAIGISPVEKTIIFDSPGEKSLTFYAINTENRSIQVEVYTSGDLQEYITLSAKELSLAPNEIKSFKVKIELPENLSAGNYTVNIGIVEQSSAPNTTGMAAQIAVESDVQINTLFSGWAVKELPNETIEEAQPQEQESTPPTKDLAVTPPQKKKSGVTLTGAFAKLLQSENLFYFIIFSLCIILIVLLYIYFKTPSQPKRPSYTQSNYYKYYWKQSPNYYSRYYRR